MEKDPNFVTALGRGLDVLRCFTPERQELGTTEIARLTGLAQSTVWRLCYTLSQYGCLTQGATSDRLRIGAGVLLLGHAVITHTGISEVAYPLMKTLADQFEASVSLAERHRSNMILVQRCEAPNIVKVDLHIGASIDITNSSLGLAYLVAIPVEQRMELLNGLREEHPENGDLMARNLEDAQEEYNRLGFVFNLGKSHRDINAIGVPVVSPDGRHVMALTCGGARSQLTKEKLTNEVAPALQALARAISPMLAATASRRR